MGAPLIICRQHGNVRHLVVNRPEKHNALNRAVMSALTSALDEALVAADTAVIIFAGAGEKAFVAGMDVAEIEGASGPDAYRAMRNGQEFFERIAGLGKPTIAMVNGYALGGGFELALSCDFIIASETAKFGFPEIGLGTFPGWGGTQLAMQKMPPAFAKEMLWSGRHYSAEECRPFGFINRIVPADRLIHETNAFALMFADKPALALEFAKTAARASMPVDGRGALIEAAHYAVNFEQVHARKAFADFVSKTKA